MQDYRDTKIEQRIVGDKVSLIILSTVYTVPLQKCVYIYKIRIRRKKPDNEEKVMACL